MSTSQGVTYTPTISPLAFGILAVDFVLLVLPVLYTVNRYKKTGSLKYGMVPIAMLGCIVAMIFSNPSDTRLVEYSELSAGVPKDFLMKGVHLNPKLRFTVSDQLPIPSPYIIDKLTGTERVLVKVSAASLNPADYKTHPMYFPILRWFLPDVAVRDFAGKVVGRTKGCKLAMGDAVLGFSWFGALSEYTMVACDGLVVKQPKGLDKLDAAGMVTTAATALMAWEEGNMIGKENPRVLVIGASGGTGSMAVSLFKAMGADVVGVSSGQNEELVRELGAIDYINYRSPEFDSKITQLKDSFDLIYDCVSSIADDGIPIYEPKVRSVLKEGAFYININPTSIFDLATSVGDVITGYRFQLQRENVRLVHAPFVNMELLEQAAQMVADGRVKVHVGHTFAMRESQVTEAFDLLMSKHTKGKIVCDVEK